MAYTLEFAESIKAQLEGLTAHQRAIIFDAIEKQLVHEPLVETRNRKPLRPNPVAPWQLRIGDLRVFYDVVSGKANVVRILAVGQKKGNKLLLAGREVKL